MLYEHVYKSLANSQLEKVTALFVHGSENADFHWTTA
jgi:hypothetical protein